MGQAEMDEKERKKWGRKKGKIENQPEKKSRLKKKEKKRKSQSKFSRSKPEFESDARGGYGAEKVNVVRSIRVLVKTSIEIRRRKKVKKKTREKKIDKRYGVKTEKEDLKKN
jgi:hypothetical protein